MKEKRFQEIIREHALTEYSLNITIKARVGDSFLGWAENNVNAVILRVLPRNGIMIDSCVVDAKEKESLRLN